MATIDFDCTEHTLPQTSSCTTTEDPSLHCRRREHAMSTKLDIDDRRLAVLMEQEQRFMPNAYHLRKVVNERERALLLETILQIEVSKVLILENNWFFLTLCLHYILSIVDVCSWKHTYCWGKRYFVRNNILVNMCFHLVLHLVSTQRLIL